MAQAINSAVFTSTEEEELEEQKNFLALMKARQAYIETPADAIAFGARDCVLWNGKEQQLFGIQIFVDGFGESYMAFIDECRARQLMAALSQFLEARGRVEGYV